MKEMGGGDPGWLAPCCFGELAGRGTAVEQDIPRPLSVAEIGSRWSHPGGVGAGHGV